MAFVDRLTPLLATGDVFSAHGLLTSLEGDDLREAKKWFGSSTRWCRDVYTHVDYAGEDHDARFNAYQSACWILAICAVRLCGPRAAAERVPWRDLRSWRGVDGEAALVQQLWDQPTEWVLEFVDASSRLSLPRRGDGTDTLSIVLRAAVVHHNLPCPTGTTFLIHWLAGTPVSYDPDADELVAWMAADPLMPEVLLGFLTTGECGMYTSLPSAVADLLRAGRLERATLMDVVLEQLTTNQRPASQRVLAAILQAVGVRAGEVRGGLGYLIGVLASGDRGVQPVLLPWALELAETADDWTAIADVVAGRPDKKAKEMVLAALKTPEVVKTAGPGAIEAALQVLGAVDDAAFAAKVASVRSRLGLTAAEQVVESPVMGLWDIPPLPSGRDVRPHFLFARYGRAPEWQELLDSRFSYGEDLRPWLVEETLSSMANGSFEGSAITNAVDALLDRRQFRSSIAAAAFEDVFLGGGLRQGWAVAVAVADLAAGAPTRPAGLAGLVRLLVRYAPEVPSPHPLPPHLAVLAGDPARTKAAMEARALAELVGMDSTGSDTHQPTPVARPRLGLWAHGVESGHPLPSTIPIVDDPIRVRSETLSDLEALLSEDYFSGWGQSFTDVCWWPEEYRQFVRGLTGLTEPDRVLAATVAAIHRHGPTGVRATLSDIERSYDPVDVVAAVDAWVQDGIDVETFWRLVSAPVVAVSTLRLQWLGEGVSHAEVQERCAALPPFATRLRAPVDPEHGALVVPSEIDSPLDRFAVLRAAEALIRAETDPVLLSLPTWRDGTMDVEDLLSRLETVAQGCGVVGPIDLVQSLHRLRKVEAHLVDGLIDRVPSGLRTDSRFTDPDGVLSWDATELVRRWLASGGLPDLEPVAKDGRWHAAPESPVPFTSLAAWPADLASDPWNPGSMPSTIRLFPRWPDRVFDEAFDSPWRFDPRFLPSLASGPLGVPFHDRLLSLLTTEESSSTLVFLAQGGRIDATAVASAARGRHQAGTLALSPLLKTLQRELETSLRGLWPMVLAIADVLCAASRRPAQLADLLRLLTSYTHEVPAFAATIPSGLLGLAESKGATKAHIAARELVEALREAVLDGL